MGAGVKGETKLTTKKWPADQVQRRSIDDLIPYARNSRTHSDEQVAQIAASMKEWGWTNPVLVDEEGTIIAGHGRILAARKLGHKEVPVMTAKGWSDAQKRAYVIADNKLALNAGWDEDSLKIELESLKELDFNLDLVGFSENELDHILEGWESDIEIPDAEESESVFKITVQCNELDREDVLSMIKRAVAESGIEGVEIKA